jgi:hypothetical protein
MRTRCAFNRQKRLKSVPRPGDGLAPTFIREFASEPIQFDDLAQALRALLAEDVEIADESAGDSDLLLSLPRGSHVVVGASRTPR